MMDGEIRQGTYTVDGAKKLSIYQDAEDSSWARSTWTFERPSPGLLNLRGELDGGTIAVKMKARDPGDFLLLNRGFHWVDETPFNR